MSIAKNIIGGKYYSIYYDKKVNIYYVFFMGECVEFNNEKQATYWLIEQFSKILKFKNNKLKLLREE